MLAAYSVQNDLLSIQLRHFQALRDFQNKYYELQDILTFPKLFRLDLTPVNKEEEITTPISFYIYQQIQQPCCFYARLHYLKPAQFFSSSKLSKQPF